MLLEPADRNLFLRLHSELLFFVNRRLGLVSSHLANAEDVRQLTPPEMGQIRDALNDRLDLIDAFVDENPSQLTQEELEIVRAWRQRVSGEFFICRELKKYAVFLTAQEPSIAYGVLALRDPFHQMVGPKFPVMVETVLLPFKGQIIYDGVLSAYSITIGPGIKRSINEQLKEAKQRHGIVTSLPLSDEPATATPARAKPSGAKPSGARSSGAKSSAADSSGAKSSGAKSLPKKPAKNDERDVLETIVGLVDPFCKEHLDEEYAELCGRLAKTLAGLRPSPLLKGSPNAWASGIVRAIGWVNFLHDKSQMPYMRAADIDQHFGVTSSAGAARSAEIRKLMDIYALDPEWTLPSLLEDNPLVWMLTVNGFVIDVRKASRELQEQAYLQGLIPYIPADRE